LYNVSFNFQTHIFVLFLDVTCTVLKYKYPNFTNGSYYINPITGQNFKEFPIYCDMTTKDGIGVTEIAHDSEARIEVLNDRPRTYSRNVTYEISMEKIVAIINQSKYCEQFIKYECYFSWLRRDDYGWWVSRQGKKMNYWGGAAIDSGKCACGMTNNCAGGLGCNCDTSGYWLRQDSGFLNDTNTLPVTELRLGDTDGNDEFGFHTLGKLRCWGQK
jgi:hypothetical protein